MLERFINKTTFESQEDFIKNFKIKVPENFNFGYDVVDAWAAEQPDKNALLWTNDKGESPKNGALLIAPFGKGHYIYTGLSFFRELPEGVTGAYKLISNIISLQSSEKIPVQKIKP